RRQRNHAAHGKSGKQGLCKLHGQTSLFFSSPRISQGAADLASGSRGEVAAVSDARSDFVKGFGCRWAVAVCTGAEGRRPKASEEGTRGPVVRRLPVMGI